jgi:penicillin amidase
VGFGNARLLAPLDPPRTGAEVAGTDYSDFADVSSGKRILAGFQAASKSLPFRPSKTESNNWVVSGDRSVSGKPLLASDPHRTTALPSLRYLVHLNAPGWNVIGAGEPALPGVALGHNDHIAWGITIVGTDQADIHVLDTKPSDPTQYWNGNGWEKMKVVEERIPMKASAKADGKPIAGSFVLATTQLSFSRQGPVIYQDQKRKKAFALKWAGSEPGGAAYLGGLAVARAQNKDDFLKALKAWHIPALNFVYADRAGTIGWVAAGLTPIRPGSNAGVVPAAGHPPFDWRGYLEVQDYPQRFNPPEGFLATANHKILPPGYKHAIAHEWAAPHRFQVIKNRLEAKPKFTLEDFKSIQHENTSLPGLTLVRLLKGIELPGPDLEKHAQLLRSWDGVLSRESPAAALYAVWLHHMQTEFYKAQVPKELLEPVRTISGISVMLDTLEKPSKDWFGDNPTSGRDRFLLKTFVTALAKVQLLLGEDPKQWSWGKLHTATFRHPLATLGPAYEKAFNLGPVPRPGDANTPNNTRHDDKFQQVHGASYRQLFDLADWDRGLATSTPGQSGQPGSPHYADLLPLWAEGEYFPLVFSRSKVEELTRHRLRLEPK